MTSAAEALPERPSVAGYRLAPAQPDRELMLRPRLLGILQSRFRTRMTTVTSGPGFGKTSLLAQALAENRLAPRGTDVWITCRPEDNAASSLGEGLLNAFELPGLSSWDTTVIADRVAAEVWHRSPTHVALILDDAHLVKPGSTGAHLLATLLDRLPRNAHIVLGGRAPLPLRTARLAASGQLTELRERDLVFTESEIAEFASIRAVPSSVLHRSGGWPALAELCADAGEDRVHDYLWEELLDRMPAERRRLLASLALVDGADDDVAAALAGEPVDLPTLLAGLPLVLGDAAGKRALHPLWRPALAGELTTAEAALARRRGAAVLRQRGNVDAAVRLLVDAAAWDEINGIICETSAHTHPLVAPDVLEEWYRRLPTEQRTEPEGVLLHALVARGRDLSTAVPLFRSAAQGFRTKQNILGEVAALTHAAHISWWRDDVASVEAAARRVGEMADELPLLHGIASLGKALAAEAQGAFGTALDLLATVTAESVPPAMASGIDWMRAWTWLLIGEPERASPLARAAANDAPGTFLAPAINVHLLSLWFSGDIEPALAEVPRFTEATVATGRALGHVFERSQSALLTAFTGRVEEAEKHLQAARAALPGASQAPMAEIAHLLAEAALLVARGDEAQATLLLAAELELRPLESGGQARWHRLFPALTYVLFPGSRPHWDAATFGSSQVLGRSAARALVAVRDGDLAAAASVDFSQPGRLRAGLPLPWAVELAVAAIAAGATDARNLLSTLEPDGRVWIKNLTAGTNPKVSSTARALLAERPPTPSSTLRIRVLGPLELGRDDELVDHPALHRERVRQLLQYLVIHRPGNRVATAGEVWPDLDPDAAGRNLRVTLNYLQRLLEPDRADGDSPFYLRAEGGQLLLRTDVAMTIDIEEFDAHLDAAARAERQGTPSLALREYEQALPLYRGDFLADLPHAEWAAVERDRLRLRYVAAAVRTGELLLAAGDTDTPLELAISALRRDPCAEQAYRLLISVRLERDEVDAARAGYRRCLQMLSELRARPEPQTEILARRLEIARVNVAGSQTRSPRPHARTVRPA
jgi:LuxR family transcriptional regulator, maltose regulon positive regulatory protein